MAPMTRISPTNLSSSNYIYDFGDSWHHVAPVEDPYAAHSDQSLVRLHCPEIRRM